ncbi:MAG TPA: DNA-processing protein DprA [Desulfosporosinus sp.]|nr:DNA-processing protein DprA [Desulfosporosinus sp.]
MNIYWLWLAALKGVGPVTLRYLVMRLGSPEAVYTATQAELEGTEGLRRQVVEAILESRSLDQAKRTEELMLRQEIKLLTFVDPLYPTSVNSFANQPAVLYYKGTLRPAQARVGIVGSRRCTTYGKQVAAEAATFLADQGITVVSGLAKGIDSYAHTACLKAGGYTLAFIANGPDICYPAEHRLLMDQIIENGAVLSPYPPGTRPRQEYFPLRNRLLSAWVEQLLVVEAGARSGALITANYALEQHRRVLAVPNSIYSPESYGTNRLLQSGAELYLEPKQLVNKVHELPQQLSRDIGTSELPIQANATRKRTEPEKEISSPQEQAILERLFANNSENPVAIRDFLDLVDGNLKALLTLLCSMELEEKVIISGQTVKYFQK